MTSGWLRRSIAVAMLACLLASCGRSDGVVRTGSPSSGPEFTPETTIPTGSSTPAAETSTPVSAPPVPGATTTAATATGPEGASPVPGIVPSELRRLVEAPRRERVRSGPTLERTQLTDGRTAWRITIPGEFPLRSARLFVAVGGRTVGQGIAVPDGSALVAVTLDGSGLAAGAAVTWGPPGQTPTAAGALAVPR